jgi:hypothetical protein
VTALSGHCLCGAVRINATDHRGFLAACHCRMCQRWTGGVFVCVPVEAQGVSISGPVARYQSSDFAERAFCSVCGSHLWFRMNDGDGHYAMMPGLFDAARDLPLKSEIYHDCALIGLVLSGDHRRATRAEYEARNVHLEGDQP